MRKPDHITCKETRAALYETLRAFSKEEKIPQSLWVQTAKTTTIRGIKKLNKYQNFLLWDAIGCNPLGYKDLGKLKDLYIEAGKRIATQ